ncbi:MAG: DNA repair protein RecO [Candidatus Eisenbacteria sp.]|nr:DNA repair protein RecO [Candidatus Eisenbacteria bacterium]
MAIVEDEALVLRSMRYRDTSRIAILLTRHFGKVHIIAKGARDPKSPFGAALDVLTLTHVVFYLKKNRTLHLLKAASVEQVYLATLSAPGAYHIASAALEFLQKVLADEDPCPAIFDALKRFLEGCESDPRNPRVEARLKAFQLHTVSLLGYAPMLEQCVHCGGSVDDYAGFGVIAGGLVCRKCATQDPERLRLLPVSAETLRRLRATLAQQGSSQQLEDRPERDGEGTVELGAKGHVERGAKGHVEREEQGAAELDREMTAIVESFLRYHVTGYQGLRSLRSLSQWQKLRSQGR